MTKREETQLKASTCIINSDFNNIIINLAPRTGKSKVVLDAIKFLPPGTKVLITAPFNSILESWEREFIKWDHDHNTRPIKLINQRSLDKISLGEYDIICCDEVHTLSEQQIGILSALKMSTKIFGITGSLSYYTSRNLEFGLGLKIGFVYSLEDAIKDKVISDYEIRIVLCELDDIIKNVPSGNKWKQFLTTEKQAYNYLTSEFNRHKELALTNSKSEKTKMFFAGQRARFLYSCNTKINVARKLINKYDRAIVFTTLISSAKKLTTKSYNSKSKGDELEMFMNGSIDKLSVINMSSMGVTIPNLKCAVCHQLQGSEEMAIQKLLRTMNFDYGQNAHIDIVAAKDTVDIDWLNKSLSSFDTSKITYVESKELEI